MTRWWRTQSVRTRLAWSYATTVAFVLLVFSVGMFAFVSHLLNEELNTRLADDFALAAESLEVSPEGVDLTHPSDTREHDEHQRWVEIWDAQPSIRFRTPRAGSAMLDDLTSVPAAERHQVSSTTAVTGERLRSRIGTVERGGGRYLIRVARSEEPLRHELRELLVGMGIALPLAIALSSVVGARMARRALRPIELMAEHARRITAERLHERLPVENPTDELGQLASVFNDTLARLDSSFHQVRRFAADASHELRTPLTALRSVGEVGLAERHDANGYRDIIGSMLEDAERLTRLVESLLTLSRADAGVAALRPERIDLSQLAREVVTDLCVLAEEKQQQIRVEAANPVFARADRMTVTQALVNLLDNAIKYSPNGAVIGVEVSADADAHLDVRDSGPGIPSAHQQRIFDRFYRIDEARARGNGGVGLGLSIARWAIHANNGQLTLHSTSTSGSTFRVTLPLHNDRNASERHV